MATTAGAPPQQARAIAAQLGATPATRRTARLRRWSMWGALALLVVAGITLSLRHCRSEAPRYVTQPVRRGDLTVRISATGTLAPTTEVTVGSELSGIVAEVLVDYDDRVQVGQVLARIDATRLEAQARQSAAQLQAARARLQQTAATLEEARAQLARLEQVFEASKGRVPSRQELDTQRATAKRAASEHASARAVIAQQRAALETFETDLSRLVIRSPIEGVVLERNVDPGQTVAASFQAPVLFTIAEDLTQMDLELEIDEADVGQVAPGVAATFTVDAYPERVFEATVSEVRFASETVEGVVTYKAILHVDNDELLLRPGMTATAEVVVRELAHVVLVPNAALRFEPEREEPTTSSPGGRDFMSQLLPRRPGAQRPGERRDRARSRAQQVWVLRDGEPVAVPVVVGASDDAMTVVRSGDLAPGTVVIVDTAQGAAG